MALSLTQPDFLLRPPVLTDPSSAQEADAAEGRRAFVEGMTERRDLNGAGTTIVQWHVEHGRWEVEMDRKDERLLVRSANLRWLDQAPRRAASSSGGPAERQPKKKKKKKAKA